MRNLYNRLYKSHFLLEFQNRPAYAYTTYWAAQQAIALGYRKISVIEFGVAGGNGLLALEHHAMKLSQHLGIEIEVYGFDLETGLPPPEDYRDVAHQWRGGFFPMAKSKLEARLRKAKLVIGDIDSTVHEFFTRFSPAPVGGIIFDVDLYSSTRSAMNIFNADEANFIPRVRCYFDDILGNEIALTNEFTGEQLAIKEYNARQENRKITPVHHLIVKQFTQKWYYKCFVHHWFNHPRYTSFIAKEDQAIPLV